MGMKSEQFDLLRSSLASDYAMTVDRGRRLTPGVEHVKRANGVALERQRFSVFCPLDQMLDCLDHFPSSLAINPDRVWQPLEILALDIASVVKNVLKDRVAIVCQRPSQNK